MALGLPLLPAERAKVDAQLARTARGTVAIVREEPSLVDILGGQLRIICDGGATHYEIAYVDPSTGQPRTGDEIAALAFTLTGRPKERP